MRALPSLKRGLPSARDGSGIRLGKAESGGLARRLTDTLATILMALRGAAAAVSHHLSPARATVAVTLVVIAALAASQFLAYRGVAVGVPDYAAAGVEAVAPPPQVDREPAGSAHGYAILPLALIALVALFLATRGRWRLGRAISLLGAVAVGITLIVDLPKGLDEGEAALAFAGAEARLAEGFYLELAAGGALIACGLLVSFHLHRALGVRSDGEAR
jgi:hypothetical protein